MSGGMQDTTTHGNPVCNDFGGPKSCFSEGENASKIKKNSLETDVKRMRQKMMKMRPEQAPGNAQELRLKIGEGPLVGVPRPLLALRGVQVVSGVLLGLFGCVFWRCSGGHFEGNRIHF